MSLIAELSSLYMTGKNLLGDMLLSLPEESSIILHDECSTASEEHSTSREVLRLLIQDLREKFDQLYSRVRLETLGGGNLIAYCMPPAQDLVYLHTTVEFLLRRQVTYTEEEMESPERRDALAQWLVGVHHHCQFKLETLHQCMSIVDGFLVRKNIQAERDRLLGITAMWLAAKLEETKTVKLKNWLRTLPEQFEANTLIEMEAEILQCFGYDFDMPNAYSFLEILATYFSLTESTYSLCCYLLELALLNCRCGAYTRSQLAAASLFVALKVMDPTQWNSTVLLIVSVDEDEMLHCANELLSLHQKAQKETATISYGKYSGKEHFRVAKVRFWPPLE